MTSFYYCYQTLQGFAFLCKLNLTEITNFKFERKNKMKCGISSKRRHRANGVLRSRLPEFISAVLIYDLFHIHLSHSSHHGNIWTHNLPAPNISGFIATSCMVRASNRYREVMGSNPVQVLDFFFQALKKRLKKTGSYAIVRFQKKKKTEVAWKWGLLALAANLK